jgi:hypothetical protein
MTDINSHNPFPSGLRGDSSKGAFYEMETNNGSKYVIIRPRSYSFERIKQFQGPTSFEQAKMLRLLGYTPGEEIHWLYLVQSFNVATEFHTDQTVFIENQEDYMEYVFDDIDKVMAFCKEQFGIEMKDFKKDWETNYPQWGGR